MPKDTKPAEIPSPPAAPLDTRARTATIDGVTYAWTQETEDTVPQAAREAWAHSSAATGA